MTKDNKINDSLKEFLTMALSTYSIKKNIVAKKIEIAVGDKMTVEEVERFQKEFIATVSSITPKEYTLAIDSTNMNVLTPELATRLEHTMVAYKQAGFKKIEVQLQNSPVLKMQVSRVARNAGLTNMEITH